MNKMKTVGVFAMVVVVASLCAAKPFYEGPYRTPDLMKHPPEPDEEHPDENYYPEPPDYPQISERQLVDLQYPRHDARNLRPTDSSDADHLEHLMIDPPKPIKARPEDYFDTDRPSQETDWPELEDSDLGRADRRATDWAESEDRNESDLEPIEDLDSERPQRHELRLYSRPELLYSRHPEPFDSSDPDHPGYLTTHLHRNTK